MKFSSKSNPNPDSEDDDFIDYERDYEQHVNQQHGEIHLNRTFHSDPEFEAGGEVPGDSLCGDFKLFYDYNRQKVEDLP